MAPREAGIVKVAGDVVSPPPLQKTLGYVFLMVFCRPELILN
jgi:hypothetical protein